MTDAYASIVMKLKSSYPDILIRAEYGEGCVIDMDFEDDKYITITLMSKPEENYYSCRVTSGEDSIRYRGKSWEVVYHNILEFVHIVEMEL